MSVEKPMTNVEVREAVSLLLQREEERAERERRKVRRRERQKQRETETGIAKVVQSIEVIKWCVLSISTVMAISMIIGIAVIMELTREAERIKGEVTAIQRDAERIREKIRHPLETIGGTLGRRLESNIGEFLKGDKPDE